ncbi:MAG: hypothetical protein EOM38_09465, partial [Bacilli bacterium]|nr:hypothetical protein [Bacilli bacterium]
MQKELDEANKGAEGTYNAEGEGNRSMKKRQKVVTHEGTEKTTQLRSAINAFVHSKGQQRAESRGMTSVEG